MCDRPLHGFKIGVFKSGKPRYLVCSSDIDYIYTFESVKGFAPDGSEKWIKCHGKVPKSLKNYYIDKYILMPCGHCLSCKLTRAAEMADRCMLEMQYHEKACFLTLTYDDDHITSVEYKNLDTGEIGVSQTLVKKDYQLFIKRLRKDTGLYLRYVLAGEYGEVTQRPHFHMILFGFFPDDAKLYSMNHRKQALYTSDYLNELWTNGYVIVGEVTRDSANYVTRYVTKKLYSDLAKEEYDEKGRIPPFIVSSKRPAIGKRWFEDHKDCIGKTISYSTPDGGHTFKPPRYFYKLHDKENCDKILLSDHFKDVSMESQLDFVRSIRSYLTDASFEQESDAKERSSKNKALGFVRDKI